MFIAALLIIAKNNKNSRSINLSKHKWLSSYTSSSQALKKKKIREKEEGKEEEREGGREEGNSNLLMLV